MKLINSFFSWLIKKRLHQIELFKKYPIDVQNELFRKLIESGSLTSFGNKYNLSKIENVKQFQETVPMHSYEDIKPYIEEIRKGKKNVLWPTDIKWFAKSSGTTSDKSKYIPVSLESLEDNHYKAGKDMLAIYCNNYPETNVFTAKGIGVGGSHSIHEIDNKEYYTGDLSAILIQNLPFWVEFMRTPDISTVLMDEWEEKIDKIAKKTISRNVVHLSGVPSWSLLLLEQVLKVTEKKYIEEVWPEFEVFFHGGVNFAPYKERFFNMFSTIKPRLLETYNASEGFFALEDEVNSGELLLLLDYGIFFEFIPLNEINNKFPKTINLEDVEIAKTYAILITTNAGLWRYLIGDTIEFTSKNPFRIKITGRTKSFINLAGEELMVENADIAITEACAKTGAIISEYTAGPREKTNSHKAMHHWLIEFSKQPSDINFFAEVLDNSLKSLNSDYEAKRYKNMILDFPLVEIMPEGAFYNWLKSKGKLGGQNKVPRLSNDPKIINELKNCAD